MTPALAGNLLEYLEQVPDPRGRQGLRHSLAAMLAAVAIAILCGQRGYKGIAHWLSLQSVQVWHRLGFWRKPPTRNGKKTVEVDYPITSVPRDLADASTLLAWWRGHWGIENRLHWVRDVTFGEDASRIRTGSAPQFLAALRNAGISLLRSLGVVNIAEAIRENACKVDETLSTLGIPNY